MEGCTTGQNFSTGYVTQYETDDLDNWNDIDCRENVGSFDPNDKEGFPRGYGAEHYIKPGIDLEYLIRFQNTGTDTAFLVVIRDTLSAALDPGSIVPGPASHPYRFDYYGDGALKFVFDNIMLPDSNVNEAASHGFVSFKVKQRENLPLETDIFNTAAIYFDGNAPVITNTTQHRLGQNFVTVSTWTPAVSGLDLSIAPNPANDFAVLQLHGLDADAQWQIEMLDATGKKVLAETSAGNQWRLERGTLPAGLYLLRVSSQGKMLGTGKVILK
ncbi:MAG: T9SS type A sorting domain-containing protein [Lewinellaceae bacterium]|nr:T9SS type A sorting domain-containing protein [Lewinellaceae bacterium]